jgi:hypothetical protein
LLASAKEEEEEEEREAKRGGEKETQMGTYACINILRSNQCSALVQFHFPFGSLTLPHGKLFVGVIFKYKIVILNLSFAVASRLHITTIEATTTITVAAAARRRSCPVPRARSLTPTQTPGSE